MKSAFILQVMIIIKAIHFAMTTHKVLFGNETALDYTSMSYDIYTQVSKSIVFLKIIITFVYKVYHFKQA